MARTIVIKQSVTDKDNFIILFMVLMNTIQKI
jgi:hypothetical protein